MHSGETPQGEVRRMPHPRTRVNKMPGKPSFAKARPHELLTKTAHTLQLCCRLLEIDLGAGRLP
jgi:hypothetical protein